MLLNRRRADACNDNDDDDDQIMVMQMIEWTGVMTDEEMLLNRRQADACKEEYCEEEAVEGGGHIVATEGEQDDVDQGCKDTADSLTSQNLKKLRLRKDF